MVGWATPSAAGGCDECGYAVDTHRSGAPLVQGPTEPALATPYVQDAAGAGLLYGSYDGRIGSYPPRGDFLVVDGVDPGLAIGLPGGEEVVGMGHGVPVLVMKIATKTLKIPPITVFFCAIFRLLATWR